MGLNPVRISKIVSFYNRFKGHFFNTSWMMAEKILQMGAGFFIAILVSRYLGPERFGVLAYATSIVGIATAVSHAGLNGLVVKELVKNPDKNHEILGSTFFIKSLSTISIFSILIGLIFFIEEPGSEEFWILIITAASLLAQPFQIVSYWFQSQTKIKYQTIANTAGTISNYGFKLILVITGANLIAFGFSNLIQIIVAALLLILFYLKHSKIPIKSWKNSKFRSKKLLKGGWIICLGSIFAIIYLKIDQAMLKWLIDSKEVGIYSVATTLSEVWYFIPNAIVVSIFPSLIRLRESNFNLYRHRLQQLLDFLFTIALIFSILINLVSDELILLTFGPTYIDSAGILSIHIWAGLFIFMRAAFSKWILMENELTLSLMTQGLGGVVNIILNLILIPKLGGYGAALATLISYATASYLALFFHRKSRPMFWMMTYSMLLVPTLGYRYWHGRNVRSR
ncbi:membrane protein involved in the export of O-antigen and teichoic acid [Leptolyngbya sp. PCC 7375]|nr:membrane protein involved in the export of O-antigen and teichoic acid [Leptolyngbya sp. PCC 7375]